MERFLLLSACLLFSFNLFARDPLPKSEAAKIIAEFQYDSEYEIVDSRKNGGFFSQCWVYDQVVETTYPQSEEPLKVYQHLYIPNRESIGDEEIPMVIMFPPIGGLNPLDKSMAKTFCKNKVAALVITNDFANVQYQAEKELLPVEDHQRTYYRVVAATKAALMQMEDDKNLDPSKAGIFGVSLGGILSSFVMATQPDISVGYFIVAGGDVPQILATSAQGEIKKIRERRMTEQGFSTSEQYETYLRKHLTIDPIDIAVTMLPETLNMVIATEDLNVPTSNQNSLHMAFGEPEAIYRDSGHLDAVIASLLWNSPRENIAQFFVDRFAMENPRPMAFRFLEQFDLSYY